MEAEMEMEAQEVVAAVAVAINLQLPPNLTGWAIQLCLGNQKRESVHETIPFTYSDIVEWLH